MKKNENELKLINDNFIKREQRIKNAVGKIEKGYISIAGDVKFLHDFAKDVIGKESFYDYTMRTFGFSRGTVGNLLVVANIICDENYAIKEHFKNFGLNQILELRRTLKSDEIENAVIEGIVKSEMTVSELRKNLAEKMEVDEEKKEEEKKEEEKKEQEKNKFVFLFAGKTDIEKKEMLKEIMKLVNNGAVQVIVKK